MSIQLRCVVVVLAAALLVPGVNLAGPTVPDSLNFVGDAARVADPGQLNWGRWGNGGGDKGTRAQPLERARSNLAIAPMTPADIVKVRKVLDDLAKTDPKLAADLAKARAGMPSGVLPNDLHPFEYIQYVKNLPDNEAKYVLPPPNRIKIVDQNEIERRLNLPENKGKTAKDILNNHYKTKKISIVTHTLTPILQQAYVYYPG